VGNSRRYRSIPIFYFNISSCFRKQASCSDGVAPPSEPCETESRSRPVPGMLLLTFRRYVTLTWMKFRMRIGPPGGRTRQDPEGRSRRRCLHESREKFACANTRSVVPPSSFSHLLSFFSFAFYTTTAIVRAKEYVAKTWVSHSVATCQITKAIWRLEQRREAP